YDQSRRGYLEMINRAPLVWAAVYRLIDRMPVASLTIGAFGAVQKALARLLEERKPRAVISVYPAYGYFLERIYGPGRERPFAFHTLVTDSITINSVWFRCASDTFLLTNDDTSRVMAAAGVPKEKLRVTGFPVPPRFATDRPERPIPAAGVKPKVLYMINAGKEKAPEIVSRLLDSKSLELSVTVGRDEVLRKRIETAAAGRPVEIHGWTDRMPELLMTHHLLIGKAGGAAVQEAIAACTPMLITHVVPGQEEGNAQLLVENQCGAVCTTPESLVRAAEKLFADDGRLWRQWAENITRLSRPDAALQIADFVIADAEKTAPAPAPASLSTAPPLNPSTVNPPAIRAFLFDIGNVLLRFDFLLALQAVAAHSKIHDPLEVMVAVERVKIAYEDGKIDRPAFLRAAFDVLSYTGTEAQFITAWEEIFEPNEPMLALVEQLAGRYPLFLLSNIGDIHREYIFRRYPIFQKFTGGVYSYEACASKPGREIFEIACRDLGLEPASTFYIDDLLPNIEMGRTLGFVSHHYHHEQHQALLDQVRAAGVTLPE
ncbi:MAG: HAD family hydrolase, partial [Verrucomicrobiota bacterium]